MNKPKKAPPMTPQPPKVVIKERPGAFPAKKTTRPKKKGASLRSWIAGMVLAARQR